MSELIVALEDYGGYDGEGLFGVFSSVDEVIKSLKSVYFGDFFEGTEFRHVPEDHKIVLVQGKRIINTWNLYLAKVDESIV